MSDAARLVSLSEGEKTDFSHARPEIWIHSSCNTLWCTAWHVWQMCTCTALYLLSLVVCKFTILNHIQLTTLWRGVSQFYAEKLLHCVRDVLIKVVCLFFLGYLTTQFDGSLSSVDGSEESSSLCSFSWAVSVNPSKPFPDQWRCMMNAEFGSNWLLVKNKL